jgi:hypothetical protein
VEESCAGGDGLGSGRVVSLEVTEGVLLDGLSVVAISGFDRRCGADAARVDGTG